MHSLGASSPSSTSLNISTSADREQKCKAIDKITGEPCGETKGLRILDEFRRLYEGRMEKIDRESDGESDRSSVKMQIMTDWIKDLGEQNTMLVHTVEDLEQTACSRVKLLEEKLKQSQMIADIAGPNYSEETLNILSNRVDELQNDEKYLQDKIEYLQSDIRGLLELIRRACGQNLWSLEGLTFFEIQPKDIPVPLDCTCGQEEQMDTDQIKSLNLRIEQLEENEKKMIRYQSGLEGKVADLTTELSMKNETIEKYVSRLQCFCDKLKEYSKQANRVIKHSSTTASDKDYDIMLIPDILESILIAKDAESNSLRLQLQDLESKLMIHSYEKNIDTNNLQMQLEEKCQKIEQLEGKLNCLEKEAIDTRDALTTEITEKLSMVMSLRTEITALEEQNHHANIGNLLKDDLIKEMCKELKQVTLKDTWKAHADKSNFSKKQPLLSISNTHYPKKGELLLFLNTTKSHIQKECEILSDLKLELRKFIEKLTINDNEVDGCITKNELYTSSMSDKLVNCIEIITKMYTEREREINIFDCMIKKEENVCASDDSKNVKLNINNMEQFKLMEEFRICTVEVQAVTEDVREEISNVVLSFNSRHQNYEELSKMIVNIQDGLAKTREGLLEAINRLELQGEEKSRYNERIVNSGLKLKDIKNEINRIQSELSCINGMQGNIIQEHDKSEASTKASTSNYLLSEAIEEIEQMLSNLQTFQAQDSCITSTLMVLKNQLCAVECSLKDLQKKNSEVLVCDELAKTRFSEKENRLMKFEKEVDCAHSKMEDVLEILVNVREEEEEPISHHNFNNQTTNDILKTKKDLHKLTKEYEDLKVAMIQQTSKIKYDERLNEWKNRVTDLEDQIRILQHETKCKQEANNFLKNSIQSVEKELNILQIKAKNDRQYHNKDSMELKKKILELENIIKMQKKTILSRSDYPSKHENISQFKILQNSIQSAKLAIQYFEDQFVKECLCEESSRLFSSTKSSVLLKDELRKCKEHLDICCHELDELSNAIHSKEKLLKNMEEVIRIQKDSLTMSQAEVKDLHQKLQDKIDKQSLIITQYEREKNELLKENELQIQTIGHLQNAVVEAKRNLDQMGHKAMSDVSELRSTISSSTCNYGNVHDV